MHLAPLKWITFKTVFLLALASGRRRSEIHALRKEFRREEGWKSITLFTEASFIAKTELASTVKQGKPLVIPSLSKTLSAGLEEDRLLCPVRALRFYIDRTKDIREGKKKLLVSFKNNFKGDISRATISHWIKKTILLAYEKTSEEDWKVLQVKAHDVRGLAASWARISNVALEEIMLACTWKSHNTFTQYYLKDLALIQEEMLKLGPIVAAQHLC